MPLNTLCFLVDVPSQEICLAEKKVGCGAGKLNGYGGKIESSDKNMRQAMLRETREETRGTLVKAATRLALIDFYFLDKPENNRRVGVYIATRWKNEPQESKEMGPPLWYPFSGVPYGKMWSSDQQWLKRILDGESVKSAQFLMNSNANLLDGIIHKEI